MGGGGGAWVRGEESKMTLCLAQYNQLVNWLLYSDTYIAGNLEPPNKKEVKHKNKNNIEATALHLQGIHPIESDLA